MLIFISLFSSSCIFDVDEAVNIGKYFSDEIVVGSDSTVLYFYYDCEEPAIEEYEIIKLKVEYYVDYKTLMKTKTVYFSVPDDIKYKDQQPYIAVEIKDILSQQSVVLFSVEANYKTEKNNRIWLYIFAVVIALALLIFLYSLYMLLCDAVGSDAILPSFMWLGWSNYIRSSYAYYRFKLG